MTKEVLAIDVDQTLFDAIPYWAEWIKKMVGINMFDYKHNSYRVGDTINAMLGNGNLYFDCCNFWKIPDLYQRYFFGLHQENESVRIIKEASKRYDVVFVSHCFPEHENSKRLMLHSVFGDDFSFISTSSKHLVRYDILIDDNPDVIMKCLRHNPGKVVTFGEYWFECYEKGILWNSEFEWFLRQVMYNPGSNFVKNWQEVAKYILD